MLPGEMCKVMETAEAVSAKASGRGEREGNEKVFRSGQINVGSLGSGSTFRMGVWEAQSSRQQRSQCLRACWSGLGCPSWEKDQRLERVGGEHLGWGQNRETSAPSSLDCGVGQKRVSASPEFA